MKKFNLNKFIKKKIFIISEIGINHDGSFEKAKKLIKLSKQAGADAVKFQIRDLKKIYNKKNKLKSNNAEAANQYIYNVLKKTHLDLKKYLKLINYAKKIKLFVGVTPWDENTAKILEYKNIDFIKIGSPDFESLFLIERCLKIRKPIILSTGMSDLKTIKKNLSFISKGEHAILHCCSSYPPKNNEISLKFLESLNKITDNIGYSGHEVGFKPTILSLFYGSRIIERHITINTDDVGPDHSSSLNSSDFKKMTRTIKQADKYLKNKKPLNNFIKKFKLKTALDSIGENKKLLSQNTKFNKIVLGKCLVYKKNILKETILKKNMLEEKSPGYGFTSINYKKFVGKKIIKNVSKGDYLVKSDFINSNSSFPKLPMKWGLVGRLGDFEDFIEQKPKLIEVHLTWRELLNEKKIPKKTNYNQELIIHAPEYFNDKLIDFTSNNTKTLDLSYEMLERTINLSRKLKRHFPKSKDRTKIVLHPGGHSFEKNENLNKTDMYKNLQKNMNYFKKDDYEIVLENIPPFPWYFGGRYYQNIFSDHNEIDEFCKSSNMRMCFDTSHAQLYCNSNKISMKKYSKKIINHTCYMHLSDAIGIDGEGAQIGLGNVDFEFILSFFQSKNLGFIPEIWQGHLNKGEGFKIALNKIDKILKRISTKSCHLSKKNK